MDMFFIAVIIVAYLVFRFFVEEEKTKQKRISEDAHTQRMQMLLDLNSALQKQSDVLVDSLKKKTNVS